MADMLVFSAHAADFCSRAGGMIALSVRAGVTVHVVDLTYGERGESEDYWARTSEGSEDAAKIVRAAEARDAAGVLGATIEFLDYSDYPLSIDRARLEQLASILRQHLPKAVVTHWNREPYNVDHEITANAVSQAMTIAGVSGFESSTSTLWRPAHFAFEPTLPRTDDTGFRPNEYVVIDDVFDVKMEALSRLRSQSRLGAMYTQWAEYRGAQARQWSGTPVRYAEAFVRHSAIVSRGLVG
jgi:4-oxalomesaconate hydratase